MSEPLKPRIDFSGPLDVEQNTAFKAQQMFNETEAQTFSPAKVDEPWKTKVRRRPSLMRPYAPNAVCGARW